VIFGPNVTSWRAGGVRRCHAPVPSRHWTAATRAVRLAVRFTPRPEQRAGFAEGCCNRARHGCGPCAACLLDRPSSAARPAWNRSVGGASTTSNHDRARFLDTSSGNRLKSENRMKLPSAAFTPAKRLLCEAAQLPARPRTTTYGAPGLSATKRPIQLVEASRAHAFPHTTGERRIIAAYARLWRPGGQAANPESRRYRRLSWISPIPIPVVPRLRTGSRSRYFTELSPCIEHAYGHEIPGGA